MLNLFQLQPPSRNAPFKLDKFSEDAQNPFIIQALRKHMKITCAMKHICRIELKKFYRGDKSKVEENRNVTCDSKSIEHQLVVKNMNVWLTDIIIFLADCQQMWM